MKMRVKAYRVYEVINELKSKEQEKQYLETAINSVDSFDMGQFHIKDSNDNVTYSFNVERKDIEAILKIILSSTNKEREKYLNLLERFDTGIICYEENEGYCRESKIFDNDPNCHHRWSWQRSTSKGDALYVCEDCGAIKKMYPYKQKIN